MKIFQINCASTGSTGIIAQDIHNHLLNTGHESYFAHGVGNCTQKNSFNVNNIWDKRLHTGFGKITGFHGFFSNICTYRLINKLKKINPDIVHLHNLHGSYLNIKTLFKYLKKSNVKVVYTLHDCWSFTGKCAHYTEVGCYKWKDECHHCPQLKKYPTSLFFDISRICYKLKKKIFTSLNNLTVTTVSNWLNSQAKMSYLSEYTIKTICNGINTDIFKPTQNNSISEKYNIPQEKFIILGVASGWTKEKGLNDFFELSKMLNNDECIVLVGLSNKQISNLPKNIIGIKKTENQEELAALYSYADVFFTPSKEETFGLVTVEAMACGTPVIVYNSTACPEIVNSDVGFIAEPNDLDFVYESIQKIKKEKKDYSLSCRNHIEKNYSAQLMITKYVELYNDIITNTINK